MRKRLIPALIIFSAASMLLCIATCAAAQSGAASSAPNTLISLTAGERAWLKDNPVLTLITDGDMAPYGFADEQGRYIGVIPDIAARLEELLGIRIKFRPMPYAALAEHVRQGSAEAATLVDAFDAPYEHHYLMTDEVLFMPYALFVRADSALAAHPPETVSGKTIALIRGWDMKNPSLDSLRGNRFVFGDSYLEAITLVLRGKADAFFDVHPATNYLLAKNFIQDMKAIKIYHEGYPAAFFVRKELPQLHSALQKALGAISRQERMELLKKWNAFLDDAAFRLTVLDLGFEERKWLRDHPVIRVGIDSQWAPVEFADDEGRGRGIALEYLKQVESMLGVRFDIRSDAPWHALLESAGSRTVDMLSCIAETPERAGFLAFTRPYLSLPIVALTGKDADPISDLHELDGRRVAVVKGYAVQEWLARDFPEIELVTAASTGDMLGMLAQGRVQACVESLLVAGYYIGKLGYGNVKIAGQTPYTYQMSMAVRNDYQMLAGILQKALDSIPAEQRNAAYQKWMTVSYERVFDYSLLWKVVLPLLLALGVFVYWTRRLFREVASRKHAEALLRTAQKNLEQMNSELETRVLERTRDFEQTAMMLGESQEMLASIVDTAVDAIIVTNSRGEIIIMNKAAESIYGYSAGETIGRDVNMLLPGNLRKTDSTLMRQTFEKQKQAVVYKSFESVGLRKDGTEFPIEVSRSMWTSGKELFATGIVRDITERKRAEQERARLAIAIEQAAEGVMLLDREFAVAYANPAMERITGLPLADILGKEPFSSGAGSGERYAHIWKSIRLGDPWNGQINAKRMDGVTYIIDAAMTPLRDRDGAITGYVAICNDVTDKKKLERQLWQSQKMEAIGTLAGGIAHDFNNILCAIIGFAELSQDLASGNSKLESNLAQVLKAGDRAKNLVKQILSFSRKSQHELRPIQTHLIIKEALKLLRASIPSTIDIRYQISDRSDIVIADATQIHQIVMNLCTNAAHAMQQAGGLMEIALKPVDIGEPDAATHAGIAAGPYLQLSVTDSGPGIPGDIIGRIFEPFFTTKEVDKGTGMGLAVVHGIVASLKGDIRVDSEPGRGTAFYVLLPRVQDAPPERHAAAQAIPKGSESVLLVDDEQVLLDVGTQTLSSLGYRVTVLRSPLEALELFTKTPAAFDVVITDQTMPQLTGYELAQRLMQVRPDIPIILCTGYSDTVTEESALALGIQAFIIKPLNRLVLAETIRRVLERRTS